MRTTRSSTVRRLLTASAATLLAGATLPLVLASPAGAATFTVNDNGDAGDATPGDGICETATSNAICTLRAAIDEANATAGADVVTVAAMAIAIAVGGEYHVTDDVTINGAGVATTSVDAAGAGTHHRWATIDNGVTVTITSMTVGSGEAPNNESGANILNHGTLHLDHVTIANGHTNTANVGTGGNLYNDGTVTIANSTVAEGVSDEGGGGIYNANAGSLTVSDTTFVDNNSTDDNGGGIYNENGATTTLTNVTFTDLGNTGHGNQAKTNGGGIYNDGTLHATGLTVTKSEVGSGSSDTDPSGGAIYNDANGALTISGNSVISNNTAKQFGGGIVNVGTIDLTDTQITANSAIGWGGPTGIGGGIMIVGGTDSLTRVGITANSTPSGAGAGGIAVGDIGAGPPHVTATDLVVSGNSTAGLGGGVVVTAFAPSTPVFTVHRATIANNTAGVLGGAAFVNEGTLNLENTTVSGNSSSGTPGAINVGWSPGAGGEGTLNLSFSTIANNDAGVEQGNSGVVNTTASLFADNAGGNCSGTVTSNGSNLDTGTSCALSGTGDVSNAGTMLGSSLGALAANGASLAGLTTHALEAGNPAIPLVASGCPATDARGVTRPATNCSAGAYQYVAPSPPPATTAPSTTAAPTQTTTPVAAQGDGANIDDQSTSPTGGLANTLPRTGGGTGRLAWWAGIAITLGAGMIGAARRGRATRSPV